MLSKGFCSHGRSLGAQRGQFGDNQRSLSPFLPFCSIYISSFPARLLPSFSRPQRDRLEEEAAAVALPRTGGGRGAAEGAPPTPVRFCGSFERTAEDASPRDKNLFPLEVNGILYDVISCIKEAGSAAPLGTRSK